MSISIIAELTPAASGEFPIADAMYIKGGYLAVANNTARDAISPLRRSLGMEVYCIDTGLTYRLLGSLDNGGWTLQSAGNAGYASGVSNSASWTLTHSLGYYPNVTVINTSGNVCWGQIAHISTASLNISFNENVSGTGYCS